MKAMILAAGLGTRLQPLTNDVPKALIKIENKTLLEIVIERLKLFGFDEIIINIHHQAEKIINFLIQKDNFNIKIKTLFEKELLGTGGGLKKAQWFFSDKKPFLVHNVDILSNFDLNTLIQEHIYSKSLVTLAIQKRETNRYLIFDKKNNLVGWKNLKTNEEKIIKKTKKQLLFGFSGIHILNYEIFSLMPEKECFSITDFYLDLVKKYPIKGFDYSNFLWLDVGKIESLPLAEKILSKIQSNFG